MADLYCPLVHVLGHKAELVSLLITGGSYFAEYTLILEVPKHPASVRAIIISELLSLGKEDFDFVGSFFPRIYEKVSLDLNRVWGNDLRSRSASII